jgi:hypothetical protein
LGQKANRGWPGQGRPRQNVEGGFGAALFVCVIPRREERQWQRLLLKLDSDGAATFVTVADLRARNEKFPISTISVASHVPGVDFALAVPGRGKKNDGRSMQ